MRRVVITGMGVVSPLGNTPESVAEALRTGTSGIRFSEAYAECGFRSRVWAPVADTKSLRGTLTKAQLRFLGQGDTLLYGYVAALQAIASSGLTDEHLRSGRMGCVVGTGGPSTQDQVAGTDIMRTSGSPKRMGPFMVVPTMSSGLSAKLCTDFGIRGIGLSITSACATSAHCIGEGALMIAMGRQDIMLVGGSEDCHPFKAQGFDAMRALSSSFNDAPERASRPFDAARDGFVDGAGGGMLILEAYEHAVARNAPIIAEVVGYGATSDGADMVAPSGEGALRCMQQALAGLDGRDVGVVHYINAHGTSTPVGDITEVRAIKTAFEGRQSAMPWIASTKSLTGHALGAAGALEVIYSLLMARSGFIAASANIDEFDPEIVELGMDSHIPRERIDDAPVRTIMSNSFGFGGTNASLVVRAH